MDGLILRGGLILSGRLILRGGLLLNSGVDSYSGVSLPYTHTHTHTCTKHTCISTHTLTHTHTHTHTHLQRLNVSSLFKDSTIRDLVWDGKGARLFYGDNQGRVGVAYVPKVRQTDRQADMHSWTNTIC